MTISSDRREDSWERVLRVREEFPDIPREAVFKEDMLRLGIAFSADALREHAAYARKSYFIFSFDRLPLAEMDQRARLHAPEEIRMHGGPEGLAATVVSVRNNPASPYRVVAVGEEEGGGCRLELDGRPLAEVEFAPTPPYYGLSTADGVPLIETAPSIEWGYLLYLTVFRMCQYFGRDEECQFCDINHNFRQQREDERVYNAVKPVARMVEALRLIIDSGARAEAYTITGGSITGRLQGLEEADWYLRYAEAIEQAYPGRFIGKMVIQALPAAEVRRIRDTGIQIYHPNYEIWDKALFEAVCPGKSRYVGRDEWIERILAAAEIFPPWSVIPNFVAGIEMSRPHGFATEEEAWASTGEGLEFFMSRGVMPRFTVWCPEPYSVLGEGGNGPASLRYHVGMLKTWRSVKEKLGAPAPRGYGQPGLGRAVFSVSSFMDVIRDQAEEVGR
ncbi:MAG: radical SAM protein [Planctomycetes bacterium]|nr:radical SAM protein [Planctomycetota bacterium]